MRWVVFDTTDPRALAAFWADVTRSPITQNHRGRYVVVGWTPILAFQYVPYPTPGKNRIHIDLLAQDEQAAEEEVQRIVGLGANRIGSVEMREVSWVVLADPDGNEFCLFPPMNTD